MTEKSKKILCNKKEIMTFLGIQKILYAHFLSLGLPVVFINGQHFAHSEALEEWLKGKFSAQQSLELPE